MSFDYSVTIRPKAGIDDSQIQTFSQWLDKQVISSSYASLEKAGNARHIQAAIRFKKQKRQDSLRRSLVSLFKFTDDEALHAVCVKAHKDFEGLIGYCAKDQGEVIYRHNCSLEHEQACLMRYRSFCQDKSKKSISQKSFLEVYKGLYPETFTPRQFYDNVAKMLQNGYNLYWMTENRLVSTAPIAINFCGHDYNLVSDHFYENNSD